jgi:hypothetical protein
VGEDPQPVAAALLGEGGEGVDERAADPLTACRLVDAGLVEELSVPLSGCVVSTPETKPTGRPAGSKAKSRS